MTVRISRRIVLSLALLLSSSPALHAQEGSAVSGWFKTVRDALALEPTWPVPIMTESPRIEECYRADVRLQPDGSLAQSFGDGKGISIIPADRFEVAFVPPSYVHHKQAALQDGFADTSMLVKYRFYPLEKRSYVFSVLLNTIFPTGDHANSFGHAIFAPMFLYGKEWGAFNVQGNVGFAVPHHLGGRVLVVNDAFQVHLRKRLWPEVEISATKFEDGPFNGKTQTFITPGLLIGRIPLSRHTQMAFGGGVSIAVTEFRTYNHAVVLTARVLFPDFTPKGAPKPLF